MSDFILALETSQSACGASVYKNSKENSESVLSKDRSHAQLITAVIDSAMKQIAKDFTDINAVAVSIGPGSFTGLRIGLTVAKAISYSREIPLILVPTHAAMSLEVFTLLPGLKNFIIAQKVNTTEFYVSRYRQSDMGLIAEIENEVMIGTDFEKFVAETDTLISPQNWFAVEKYVNLSSPKPCFVAEWALQYGERVPYTEIDDKEPLYLKDFVIKKKAH